MQNHAYLIRGLTTSATNSAAYSHIFPNFSLLSHFPFVIMPAGMREALERASVHAQTTLSR